MMGVDEKIAERRMMLEILVQAFGQEISVPELSVRLKLQVGRPVSERDMQFHIAYLVGAGVASARRVRGGQSPLHMVRATNKGVQTVDGLIEPEPGLGF